MSTACQIIIVSIVGPDPYNHGGTHRVYQIQHDCQQLFGEENVRLLSFGDWQQEYARGRSRAETWWHKQSLRFWRQLGFLRESFLNPARVVDSYYWHMSFHDPAFVAAYRAELAHMQGKVVCIVDDSRFRSILQHNRRAGIPSLLAPQNVQFLHDRPWLKTSAWGNRARAGNFLYEFQTLALAQRTLLISKVEAGVVGGVGLPAAYYPYRPTGEVAHVCDEIRTARQTAAARPGDTPKKATFLFIGSAGQWSSVAGVDWLLDGVTREPLADSIELLVVGGKTDLLAAGRKLPSNVSILGRVSTEKLRELMIEARAVLIPGYHGMGVLTRLTEINRSGVPLIVSTHGMYAVDPLPGVTVLEPYWPDWAAAINAAAAKPPAFEVVIPDESVPLAGLRRWILEAADGSASA